MNTPAWNNDDAYTSLQSAEFAADWKTVAENIKFFEAEVAKLKTGFASADPATIGGIQNLVILKEKTVVLASTISTFITTLMVVDSKDAEARAKQGESQMLWTQMSQALTPLELFINRCSEEVFNKILAHPELQAYRFHYSQYRSQSVHLLSEAEESLMQGLAVSGHSAWGTLYNSISGQMKVTLRYPDRTEEVGLAKAHSMTRGSVEADRKAAWQGIQEAWTVHQESSAAILNALAGWRLEECKKRSHTKAKNFLDTPIFEARISNETLDAMMAACQNNIADIRKGLKLQAQLMKKPKMDPWDLLAPSPIKGSADAMPFDEAIELIANSFSEVSAEMGEFVRMMARNNWIEGRVMPNKRTGAFCTYLQKPNQPRVFMTYMGSNSDVSTLAHELGHAFHSWSMRDMPLVETEYPMTLAETASIFAETVLQDALLKKAKTYEEKVEVMWGDVEGAISLLLNIPARFTFEKNLYERRQERTVEVEDLSKIMDESWSQWYGDALSENDRLFWAHKLHFSFSGISFYNFPYTFGYLFSLSIYARRESLGKDFMKTYVEILRDTGRMTAEDLIMKHLGEDIRKPEFWEKAIGVVKQKITNFERLVSK